MESIGDVVAGGLGGLACVLAGQPLDTIKVKLQTYPHLFNSLPEDVPTQAHNSVLSTTKKSQRYFRGSDSWLAAVLHSSTTQFSIHFLTFRYVSACV